MATKEEVNPAKESLSIKQLEMSNREIHDFVIQIIRDNLKKDRYQTTSCSSTSEITPSLCFKGSKGMEDIAVRTSRILMKVTQLPKNILEIKSKFHNLMFQGGRNRFYPSKKFRQPLQRPPVFSI